MTVKSVIFKILEYTPLGFIPGAIRISSALNKDNVKINKIALSCLNVQRQDWRYDKGKELKRGIISCIPIINLYLIYQDCIDRRKTKIELANLHEPEVRKKNIEKAQKAILVLDKYYKEINELRTSNLYDDLVEKYSGTKMDEENRKEILQAFHILYDSITKLFGAPSKKLYEYEHYTSDSFLQQFDMDVFISCLERWCDGTSPERKFRHAYYILEVSADTNVPVGKYIRNHYQTVLDLLENELKKIE